MLRSRLSSCWVIRNYERRWVRQGAYVIWSIHSRTDARNNVTSYKDVLKEHPSMAHSQEPLIAEFRCLRWCFLTSLFRGS